MRLRWAPRAEAGAEAWTERIRRRGLWRRAACGAVSAMAALTAISAHEIGTTHVTFAIRGDGTFHAEVTTDAQTIADRLASAQGGTTTGDQVTAQWLGTMAPVFGDRVCIRADGRKLPLAVHARLLPASSPGGGPVALLSIDGRFPAATRQVSWAYGWTVASYALTIERPDRSQITVWLEGDQATAPIALTVPPPVPSQLQIAQQYLRLGFTHILPGGFDHVLFVLGLYLLGGGTIATGGFRIAKSATGSFLDRRLRSRHSAVFAQVTTFTVAHSITLALGLFGIVRVAPRIVEPLIAVSIVYVAIENLLVTSLTWRRIALVFGFGLLHGLGFASALADVGLPRSAFATALVTFNVGVELGQLSVIALAFAGVGVWFADRAWYRRRIVVPASCTIAAIAAFWTVERLLS